MADLLLNTTGSISVYIEADGTPLPGREVLVTVTSPAGAEIVVAGTASDLGDGWYRYSLSGSLLTTRGTYHVLWTSSGAPTIEVTTFHTCGVIGPDAATLGDLRMRIVREARLLRHRGTVGAGSTTTSILDATLVIGDSGEHAGRWIYFRSGDNAGACRFITNSVHATSLTIAPALDETPTAGDRYVILDYDPESLLESINDGIRSVANDVHLERVDVRTTTVADQARYSIPAGFRWLSEISIWDADNECWDVLEPFAWAVHGDGVLRLTTAPDEDDLAIQFTGYMGPEPLYADSQYCEVLPEYIANYVLEVVHAELGGGPQTDPDDHRKVQAYYGAKTQLYRKRATTRLPQGAVPVGG